MDPSLDIKPEKVCRVCLSDSTELKSLQAKLNDEDKTILEVINFVVNIDMKLEKDLPDKICNDCETILDFADIFKQRCLNSEEILGQEHPTTEKNEILKELPVTFEKRTEFSSANATLKDVVDKLIEKDNDFYANVTISKHKGKTSNPKIDPLVIETDDDDIKVEYETPLDNYENIEYLDDSVDCDETLGTEATHSETKVSKLKKSNIIKDKKAVMKKMKKEATPKKPTQISCDKCGKIFNVKESLRSHMTRKHDLRYIGEFKCDICNKTYSHKYKLKCHFRYKHTPWELKYEYPCKKCNRQFQSKFGLKKHLKSWHVKCFCTQCNLKFLDRGSLEEHKMECHEKDKTQLCTFCGKWITDAALPVHILRHKNIRAWQCEMCEKSFVSRSELRAHIRTHTGERKYICPICGKAFSKSSTMKSHHARHSDERPFACKYCSKSFKQKYVLRNHIRTHTGEKPYECSLCDAAFPRDHHLAMHLKRHARDTPNIEEVKAVKKRPGRPSLMAKETESKEPAPTVSRSSD